MASQGALEYPGRRSSHAVGWMDMEPGTVEAAEQVETRERRKENTRLLDSRLCNPSRKLTATVSSSVEGASPKVLPLPTLGSRKKNKKGGVEGWKSRTPPLYREGQRDNTG